MNNLKRHFCLLTALAFLFISGFAPVLSAVAEDISVQESSVEEPSSVSSEDTPKTTEKDTETDDYQTEPEKSEGKDAEQAAQKDSDQSEEKVKSGEKSAEASADESAEAAGSDKSAARTKARNEAASVENPDAGEDSDSRATGTFTFEDETISVQAQVSSNSVFTQADTRVKSQDLHLEGDTTKNKRFSALSRGFRGEVRTVDLSFCTQDGEEAEQTRGTTQLTLTLPEEGRHAVIGSLEVYRLDQASEGKQVKVEQVRDITVDEKAHAVTFDAGEELSAYAVRYTVDYYYKDQVFHMPGGSRMLLSELFKQLGIKKNAADVEEIQFSNDKLISFTRYDDHGDWVIQSLKPFRTKETLTLIFSDGEGLILPVTDDQSYTDSNNLNQFITAWTITVGDVTFSSNELSDNAADNPVLEYKDGMQYSMELSFAERPELGFSTPETDPPAMYFQLPDCFQVPEGLSLALNVNLGRKGVLPNNMITVVTGNQTQAADGTISIDPNGTDADGKKHQYLRLDWNWEDTLHWNYFRDSAQARLKITISGTFRDDDPNVLSINGKDVAIRREDLHNARVYKTGTYDRDAGVINYSVTVSSDGTTSDITLTDTLGSALIYQGDVAYDAANSDNTAGTTPQITARTGNTFNIVIPAMNDRDRLVFTYSAAVDFEGIAVSGNPTFEETGNTAQIFGDSYTMDNTAIYHETNIEFSDLEKNVIGKRTQSFNGNICYILTWEIETNKSAQYPLADTDIKDTIGEAIQSFSKYYGSGLTIKCYAQDGTLKETRQISWDDLGVDLATDVTWTYHIPDTDPKYRYVLTYDTIVDMGGKTETVVAENTAEGKGGIDTDRAVLPPRRGPIPISPRSLE